MKPHSPSQGRSQFPARAKQLPSVEHVLERIKTLTGELQAAQSEIYGQISEPAELMERRSLLEDAGAARVLEQFRTALDHIRGILWLCMEAEAEAATGAGAGDPRRNRELARANRLLRALSTPSGLPAGDPLREPVSFFDRLDRVIDTYIQDGGTLRAQSHGKRPKT